MIANLPEEELLPEPRTRDVLPGVRHDPQPHARGGGGRVHNRGWRRDAETTVDSAEKNYC